MKLLWNVVPGFLRGKLSGCIVGMPPLFWAAYNLRDPQYHSTYSWPLNNVRLGASTFMCKHYFYIKILHSFYIKILHSFLFLFLKIREREREGEREGEKYQCVAVFLCAPSWGLACNPGMYPESNQQPSGSQAGTQSTEPHQPGLMCTTFHSLKT